MGIQQSILRKVHLPTSATAMFAAVVMALGITTSAFAATTVVVQPGDMHGWMDGSAAGGSVSLVEDAPEGFGDSSLELDTGDENVDRAAYFKNTETMLTDINELSYYTKQVTASSAGGSASYQLVVDLDGDGDFDTTLVYEPYWQNAENPDSAPVAAGEWQSWDVDSGVFWSSRSYDGNTLDLVAGAGGAPFYSLEELQAAFSDAVVQSFGANIGTYNTDYTIRVDGINFNGTVYDFEANSVVSSKDECKNNGWKTLVSAGGDSFKNQGQCVATVASSENSRHNR